MQNPLTIAAKQALDTNGLVARVQQRKNAVQVILYGSNATKFITTMQQQGFTCTVVTITGGMRYNSKRITITQ